MTENDEKNIPFCIYIKKRSFDIVNIYINIHIYCFLLVFFYDLYITLPSIYIIYDGLGNEIYQYVRHCLKNLPYYII